jgi:hypothetical protein
MGKGGGGRPLANSGAPVHTQSAARPVQGPLVSGRFGVAMSKTAYMVRFGISWSGLSPCNPVAATATNRIRQLLPRKTINSHAVRLDTQLIRGRSDVRTHDARAAGLPSCLAGPEPAAVRDAVVGDERTSVGVRSRGGPARGNSPHGAGRAAISQSIAAAGGHLSDRRTVRSASPSSAGSATLWDNL